MFTLEYFLFSHIFKGSKWYIAPRQQKNCISFERYSFCITGIYEKSKGNHNRNICQDC